VQTPHDLRAPEREFAAVLGGVARRLRLRVALRAIALAAVGFAATLVASRAAGVTSAAGWIGAGVAGLAVGAAAGWFSRRAWRTDAAALALEAAEPGLRNLAVTAASVLAHPERTRPYMRYRVLADAVRRAGAVPSALAVPLARSAMAALVAVGVAGVAWLVPVRLAEPRGASSSAPDQTAPAPHPGDARLHVEITPPAYTGRPRSRVDNPVAIEALAGSRLDFVVASGDAPKLRVNGRELVLRRDADHFVADASADASGYVAVEAPGLRRVLPLTVIADGVPQVRIGSPARDMRVPDARQAIPVEASAADDLGLASLDIRYTKISGKGEQFEFTEGTLPASIDRRSGTEWGARSRLDLAALQLEPGDSLVYRAVAADRRPGGAGTGSSETYFVEVAGPGEIALPGFDMPPDRERYAISQQMIVLKIERLRAREKSLAPAALAEEAANIAAEQRAVRANFIFLLGGTVEDEEEEAHAESEIAEGRFENDARREVLGATRLMQQVEQALGLPSTSNALPPARAAAQALQRAFGHNRYLLRALAERSRVDPSRRLSGDLADASDWKRALAASGSDGTSAAARLALADLLAIARSLDGPGPGLGPDALARLAEHVLAVDPGAADLAGAATALQAARDLLAAGRTADARDALSRAGALLAPRAQHGATVTSAPHAGLERLAGALAIGARR
jgi:hypothetical protein